MSQQILAAAQFNAGLNWRENLENCLTIIEAAAEKGADLLLLPETAMYCRAQPGDPLYAQPLDGEFVEALTAATRQYSLAVVVGMTEPADGARVFNTVVVVAQGRLLTYYRKLHLYDAFAVKESASFAPGNSLPPTFVWRGWRFGLMTCYDVRFPEQARYLATEGAEVLLLPAAWFAGTHKLWHWQLMCAARALENGVYMVAADLCGLSRIGHSRVVDPLGVTIAELDDQPGMITATVTRTMLENTRRQLPLLSQRRFALSATLRNE